MFLAIAGIVTAAIGLGTSAGFGGAAVVEQQKQSKKIKAQMQLANNRKALHLAKETIRNNQLAAAAGSAAELALHNDKIARDAKHEREQGTLPVERANYDTGEPVTV